jgi:hypothetical protein
MNSVLPKGPGRACGGGVSGETRMSGTNVGYNDSQVVRKDLVRKPALFLSRLLQHVSMRVCSQVRKTVRQRVHPQHEWTHVSGLRTHNSTCEPEQQKTTRASTNVQT